MGGRVMATKFERGAIVEARMWPHCIVMATPDFDEDESFAAAAEPLQVQALIAQLAVEALVGAVLPGFARIDEGGLDVAPSSHFSTATLMNSGPLSDRRKAGAPRSLISRVNTSMTGAERMLPATSIARHSRVNSSMMVRHLSFWPLAQASKTKS